MVRQAAAAAAAQTPRHIAPRCTPSVSLCKIDPATRWRPLTPSLHVTPSLQAGPVSRQPPLPQPRLLAAVWGI